MNPHDDYLASVGLGIFDTQGYDYRLSMKKARSSKARKRGCEETGIRGSEETRIRGSEETRMRSALNNSTTKRLND